MDSVHFFLNHLSETCAYLYIYIFLCVHVLAHTVIDVITQLQVYMSSFKWCMHMWGQHAAAHVRTAVESWVSHDYNNIHAPLNEIKLSIGLRTLCCTCSTCCNGQGLRQSIAPTLCKHSKCFIQPMLEHTTHALHHTLYHMKRVRSYIDSWQYYTLSILIFLTQYQDCLQ